MAYPKEDFLAAVSLWAVACEGVEFYLIYLYFHREDSCSLILAAGGLCGVHIKIEAQWYIAKAC
jgi:hypothetical protein